MRPTPALRQGWLPFAPLLILFDALPQPNQPQEPSATRAQERADAEALLRQLALVMGLNSTELQVAAQPAAAVLAGAARSGQPLAFYPGGALQVLDDIDIGEDD